MTNSRPRSRPARGRASSRYLVRILQERQAQAEEEAEARQAAHRLPVQVHGPGKRAPPYRRGGRPVRRSHAGGGASLR